MSRWSNTDVSRVSGRSERAGVRAQGSKEGTVTEVKSSAAEPSAMFTKSKVAMDDLR